MQRGAMPVPRRKFGGESGGESGERLLPQEHAVALSFNGSTQAVMMATPDDLVDFAYGFALTEGLARPDEIEEITVVAGERGTDVQTWLVPEAEARLKERRRTMAGPVGCGLCGIDSIEQALREMPRVAETGFRMRAAEVMAAIDALPAHQPLHDVTRAAHCAAYWVPGGIYAAREDVGRHNALDKLAGHLIRHPHAEGAVVLTSRVSTDMVQKVAAIGAAMLIAVSAPTADAVALADQLGITLIALARPDRFELFTHPHRLIPEDPHVR
ncbi:formate dehydrogenase accessory sulfurtransferase FdhD [Pseudogemmobacter sp. CC-YST710]|uniref:Sulfur carrier protein FdhD n=2 Tax=Pseudogemmobacter faecipullorum TaxID=2755041 RepID=A0ABS8CGQ6_9RHOB|nr:formate dehydrogenase accessory sulfurtransferase FdhD [Pseudogemmobacter faecipullorum]